MTLRLSRISFVLSVGTVLLAASPSLAASWQSIDGYQPQANVNAAVYVPDNVDESPGILVSIHYCGGGPTSGQGWFQGLADQYGFIIIAPDAPGNCFDAAPGRSGERADIAAMVDAVLQNYGADPTRVFGAGASSGACMSQAVAASYPEKFAGAAALAGVPVGFWTGGSECSVCGQNPPQNSAEAWGDMVRNAADGNGPPWPRVQLWHATADTTLNYPNLAEEEKQWTNVWGVSDGIQESGAPAGFSRTVYQDGSGTVVVEVNVLQGGQHDLTGLNLWPDVVRFFGLDQDPEPTGTGGAGGTGGDSSTGGDSATGGSGTGGADNTGGVATGGTNAGGNTSGGTPSGGTNTGGTSSGGASSGGTTAGGASTGGNTNSGDTSSGVTTASGGTGGPSLGGTATITGGGPGVAGGAATPAGGAGTVTDATGSGASATGTAGTVPPTQVNETQSGCSCGIPGSRGHRAPLGVLLALGLTALAGPMPRRVRRKQRTEVS